jgi:hypothetical protein
MKTTAYPLERLVIGFTYYHFLAPPALKVLFGLFHGEDILNFPNREVDVQVSLPTRVTSVAFLEACFRLTPPNAGYSRVSD